LTRISAFQLLFFDYFVDIELKLSDGQSGDTSSPEGAFAMSSLASGLAVQQLSHSMRLFFNNISLRRDNI